MLARHASADCAPELLLDGVDRVFCHRAIGRPLPSEHADQSTSAVDFDLMLAQQLLGLAALTRTDQRTHAREASDNFLCGERSREIAIQLLQEIIDLRTLHHQ